MKENRCEAFARMARETVNRNAEDRKQSNEKGPGGEDDERLGDSGRRKVGKDRNRLECAGIESRDGRR